MDTFNRPKPTRTAVDPEPASSIATARTEDHVVWDDPDRVASGRLEVGFVVTTWLMCVALTVVLFAVSAGIVAVISQRPLGGDTNTELGVLMILSAMSTFIGFVVMMGMRLVHVAHDRVVNSLAVAALHVSVALVLFLGALAVRQITGSSVSSLLGGGWSEQLGTTFTVLERSAAASVIACLLAIGIVPARGDRPRGTQSGAVDQDRHL